MPVITTSTAFQVQEITFHDHWHRILNLRDACRRERDPRLLEQLFPANMHDEFDDTAMHWGVFNEDMDLVASARMSIHREVSELPDRYLISDIWHLDLPAPIASLNLLSVASGYRRNGIAAEMDRVRVARAKRIGCKCICATAHGDRERKLMADGFVSCHSEKLSTIYGTNELTGEKMPLGFYYKILNDR
jgi:hypothetical protein